MECLDENTIVSFFEGRGSRVATAHVDEHLADCGACRRLVAEYAAVAPALHATLSSAVAARQASAAAPEPEGDLARHVALAEAVRSATRARRRLGTVLGGKYRLDRVLGVGGMAVVYKATHRNEAEFAVKMLHPELGIREQVQTRFLREGKAANSVKHPGVVRVVDDDVAEDGAAFLVMELLQGVTVASAWERSGRTFSVKGALSLADQLLDVLTAAHARGIVHRDLKPANLFITRDGSLKVLDFGIARVRDAAASGRAEGTATGMLLGTPEFMAPEQAFGKSSEIDGQTDLWAVGATLFTLLSGQHVHAGDNPSELMVRAATERARQARGVIPDAPAAVAHVIDRALSFDKATRWPNAVAMREAVKSACLDAFGEEPQKGALAALALQHERPEIAFDHVGSERVAGSFPAAPVRDTTPRARPARSGATARTVMSVAALAVLAAAALGARTVFGGGHGATASMGALAPPTSETTASTPAAPITDTAVPSTSAALVPSAPPPPIAPRVAVATTPSRAPPRPAASSPVLAAPPPAKPRADCNPNFTYDANGNKIFKPACFGQ